MNKQIVALVIGGIVLIVVAYAEYDFVQAQGCREPNPSTVFCAGPFTNNIGKPKDPDPGSGWSGGCQENGNASNCAGFFEYDIRQFADGTISSDWGLTKQDDPGCYQRGACTWSNNTQTCYQTGQWSIWLQGSRYETITMPTEEIDENEPCHPNYGDR